MRPNHHIERNAYIVLFLLMIFPPQAEGKFKLFCERSSSKTDEMCYD